MTSTADRGAVNKTTLLVGAALIVGLIVAVFAARNSTTPLEEPTGGSSPRPSVSAVTPTAPPSATTSPTPEPSTPAPTPTATEPAPDPVTPEPVSSVPPVTTPDELTFAANAAIGYAAAYEAYDYRQSASDWETTLAPYGDVSAAGGSPLPDGADLARAVAEKRVVTASAVINKTLISTPTSAQFLITVTTTTKAGGKTSTNEGAKTVTVAYGNGLWQALSYDGVLIGDPPAPEG